MLLWEQIVTGIASTDMNTELTSRLESINGLVNGWRALVRLLFAIGGVALLVSLAAASDLAWRFGAGGRIAVAAAWAAAAVAGIAIVARAATVRRTSAAVAAMLERHFPQLDNHLINHVQFAAETGSDPLRDAYMRTTSPGIDGLPLNEMRPNRPLLYGLAAMVVGVAALAAPYPCIGPAWNVAVKRVVNPFSALEPASLAHVVEVAPGDVSVPQGDSIALSCVAVGRSGQPIDLEIAPDDDQPTTLRLGRLDTTDIETEFAHRIAKVSGSFRYRFIAGDAPPTPYHRVTPIPPLVLSSLSLRIDPPTYTRLPSQDLDALADVPAIPYGSGVTASARLSRAASSAAIATSERTSIAGNPVGNRIEWSFPQFAATNSSMRISAVGQDGGKLEATIRLNLLQDRPPVIEIVKPLGATVLPPGANPVVEFKVTDDYGVASAQIESISRNAKRDAEGKILTEWNSTNGTIWAEWRGLPTEVGGDAAFRVVAFDTASGKPNRAVSQLIVFDATNIAAVVKEEERVAAKSALTLGQLIDRQRANLDSTRSLEAMLPAMDPTSWNGAREREAAIIEMAAALLKDGSGLGSAKAMLERASRGPMLEAEATLGRMESEPAESRVALAEKAAAAQEAVLRMLTNAGAAVDEARSSQASSGLLAQIEALIKAQEGLVAVSRAAAAAKKAASEDDCDAQDDLAMDVGELIDQCRRDAKSLANSDEAFAATLSAVADLAEQRSIKNEMLHAAEAMSGAKAENAIPFQERAIEGLKALCDALNEQRTEDAQARMEDAAEVVSGAKEAMGKLKDLQSAVVEALRATEGQEDKSGDGHDEALDLEIEELKSAMADAALKIATDLQVFPDLPVGNELVEDVFQIYEAMAQPKGSESTEVTELGLQKEDWILDALKTAEGRLDDMEMWLTPRPDAIKRNIENFDREELPQIGMVTMPDELEDIIGDLLDQEDELRDQADDSTGNQGTADIAAGWDIMEGEFTSYGAKGKSGNERPEHKDQDGRSTVGRQGQSDGEVVGASGKINDGDENIEKRMTRDSSQAGEIEEEDHREAKATGGGKLSGYGEQEGMAGLGPRRDSSVSKPSELGRQAMLRRDAETLYARATMNHLRTGRLDEAIRHMRMAEEALEKGLPIQQVREFQRRASVALRETQADLDAGIGAGALGAGSAAKAPDTDVASTPDEAPPAYRGLVSDYFKALGQ